MNEQKNEMLRSSFRRNDMYAHGIHYSYTMHIDEMLLVRREDVSFTIFVIIVEMAKFCTKNEIASHAKSSASEEAIVQCTTHFLYVNISFYRISEANTLP